jgi:hypothetical protein
MLDGEGGYFCFIVDYRGPGALLSGRAFLGISRMARLRPPATFTPRALRLTATRKRRRNGSTGIDDEPIFSWAAAEAASAVNIAAVDSCLPDDAGSRRALALSLGRLYSLSTSGGATNSTYATSVTFTRRPSR